jgi:hypothetical protein
MMLNSASFTRSDVGRVNAPSGVFSTTPLALPVITRIHFLLSGESVHIPLLRHF